VTASVIPAAQESMEKYKAFMNHTEVVPHVPVIPLQPFYTTMEEVLAIDPKQITVGELHKHSFYLETILETGADTLTHYKIRVGSVIITWQIYVDDVYQAYSSLTKRAILIAITGNHSLVNSRSSKLGGATCPMAWTRGGADWSY